MIRNFKLGHDEKKLLLNSIPKRLIVVGGGITGLAAAHRLVELKRTSGADVDVTLLEASDRLGGAFGTERVGDYTIELGADSFITNKPWGIDLVKRLGMEGRMVSPNPEFRRSLILHRGKPVETPVGFNLLAPGKIWPMVKTPLLSPLGKLRAAADYVVPRRKSDDDESLASFVRRRFGQEMLDRIVQPMVGGIYTSDPERLSLQATLPRFVEMERRYGSLIRGMQKSASAEKKQSADASGARYGLFATPKAGMSDLLRTLANETGARVSIRLGFKAQQVQVQPNRVVIHSESGERVEGDGFVLALPAYRSAELLEDTDSDLSNGLNEIEYASSAIVVTGHKLKDVAHPLDAFGLVIPHCENRKILAVSFLSRKFPMRAPTDRVILRTFVGGAMQPEQIDCSDEELIETVLAELHVILGVGGEPDFARIVRYNRAMPQYTVGHRERVRKIRELAVKHTNISLAGNAFEGVGIPDCIHSGESSAETLWNQLVQTS